MLVSLDAALQVTMNLTAGEPVYFISPAKLPQERRQRQADYIKEKAGDAASGVRGLVVVDVVDGGDGTVAMVKSQSPSFQAYIRYDTLTVAASFLTLALSSAITSFTDCRCFCLRLTGANHGRMAWHCLLSSLAAYRHRIIARLSNVC
ncbi:hypothetical protein C0Q70_01664 [Pomacea canaliculata]|uniref:Uncharacterized protein n=1 Tax=Pomacea canaliculata TaxID=400727 RepID=A0A2T7Q070_POMCA|nr:hypothetical protein C0Q70_01664 [Pomacea canaliculata]